MSLYFKFMLRCFLFQSFHLATASLSSSNIVICFIFSLLQVFLSIRSHNVYLEALFSTVCMMLFGIFLSFVRHSILELLLRYDDGDDCYYFWTKAGKKLRATVDGERVRIFVWKTFTIWSERRICCYTAAAIVNIAVIVVPVVVIFGALRYS